MSRILSTRKKDRFKYCPLQRKLVKDTKSISKCTVSLQANYYISEYNYGADGVQPFNYVTIGGNLTTLRSYSFIGENDIEKQFRWLNSLNITVHKFVGYQNSSRAKPSDHQLVINTSSTKFKITFLNATLPTPSG